MEEVLIFGCSIPCIALVVMVVVAIRSSRRQKAEDARRHQERWEFLCARFGPDAARRIMGGMFWQGQTVEMLIEALGRPVDVDETVMRTKVRHVFKYLPAGANRYGLRITLENNVVVGWDR